MTKDQKIIRIAVMREELRPPLPGIIPLAGWVLAFLLFFAAVAYVSFRLAPPKQTALWKIARMTPEQKNAFMIVLKSVRKPDIVGLSCSPYSEDHCIAMEIVRSLYRDSGWTVQSGIVHRVSHSRPQPGLSLYGHIPAPPANSEFAWVATSQSMLVTQNAFKRLEISTSINGGDVPNGMFFIHFNPEH